MSGSADKESYLCYKNENICGQSCSEADPTTCSTANACLSCEPIETEDGYVILQCISTFNREETEANKVKIVAQRKREVFGAQYDAFVATLTKQLNQKLWDSVELVDDENVTTTGFMEIYEQYFHS